jgi:hypothetical protein
MLGTRNLELDGVEPSARGLKSQRGEPLVSPAQLETATRPDGGFAFKSYLPSRLSDQRPTTPVNLGHSKAS